MITTPADPPPHPLLGELIVIPPAAEADAVVARLRQWNSSLRPWDAFETWLLQGMARETIRLERLHQQEIALRHARALRAGAAWDDDRRGAAGSLAAGLSRHPARTLAELRRTKHGCELIAGRWDLLLAALEARGSWTEAQRTLALNLLDVPPEFRDGPTPLDPTADADPLAHLRALAIAQSLRHRDLAAALAPVDAADREAARLGLGPDTPELAALRREERAADRRLAWSRSQFKSSRPPRRLDRQDSPASPPADSIADPSPRPPSSSPARRAASTVPAASAASAFSSPAVIPPRASRSNLALPPGSPPAASGPRHPPRAAPGRRRA